jgi:hypothetical protein
MHSWAIDLIVTILEEKALEGAVMMKAEKMTKHKTLKSYICTISTLTWLSGAI